jgi:hypothetical protein
MLAQAIRFHKFADDVPGLLAVHKHSVCYSQFGAANTQLILSFDSMYQTRVPFSP